MENTGTAHSGSSFVGRIGVARADITPPAGIFSRTWGAAAHDVAESVHRPLTLSALTFSHDDGPPLVLLEADASWWQSQDVWRIMRDGLLGTLQLHPASLIFAVSHTHAAPPLTRPEPDTPGGRQLSAWIERVMEAAIETAHQALEESVESRIDWRFGHCALAAVRDYPEPGSDSQRMICGYNPDVDADDTVLVGRVTDREGKLRATLTNYACHPTTLAWENRAISPDYVGAMRELVEQQTGAPALFLQGASGELAPRHQYVADTDVADRHGRQLGYSTLATLMDMEPPATCLRFAGVVESGAPLALWRPAPAAASRQLDARRTVVTLPLKAWPSVDELDQRWASCGDRALKERIRRRRNVRLAVGDGSTFSLPVSIWRIGDAVLVGSMAESYSLLQRELRRRFPQRAVVVGNLMNGSIGYLPPVDCYDRNIYQVWQTPFERGALELVVETMSEAIEELLRG